VYGCRVLDTNPAHLEAITSGRSGPRGCLQGFAKDGNAFGEVLGILVDPNLTRGETAKGRE
jgi:hypothetical protein